MADGYNKVLLWQVVIAAAVGFVWLLVWELLDIGFFWDLSDGMYFGFVGAGIVLVAIGLIAGAIWAAVGSGAAGGFNQAWSANLDKLGASGLVTSINNTMDSWKRSGPILGGEWALKVFFFWGVFGGIVWGFGPDSFGIAIVAALLGGLVGGLAVAGLYDVAKDIAEGGEGFPFLGFVDSLAERWASWGQSHFWGFAGALAWGVGGFFAAGGLGMGIAQGVPLGSSPCWPRQSAASPGPSSRPAWTRRRSPGQSASYAEFSLRRERGRIFIGTGLT